MMKLERISRIFLLIFTLALITGCGSESTHSALLQAEVAKVVDGDTLQVVINGKKETIRLLLVDTPETVHPSKPVQPFGPEASNFLKEKLNGKEIQFELGIGERDKYGRLLAYVYYNDEMINKLLLEKGLARVAYVFEPNTKYIDEFYETQKKAQTAEIGIWSLENYATENGFQENGQEKADKETMVNSSCTIKGNINSKGEKIYHTIQSPSYDVTKPEEIFCTEKEAVEAGYRAVKR